MANTQAIKSRIRSVKSTKQITKAMELVSASKMRKAQEATLSSRVYTNAATEILNKISSLIDVSTHPLYAERKVKSKLVIAISSDRTLAGAYNSNIMKKFTSQTKDDLSDGVDVKVLTIGRIISRFVSKIEGVELLSSYEHFPDRPTVDDVRPIINTAVEMYTNKEVDVVEVLFTDFKSSIQQEPTISTLLPAATSDIKDQEDLKEAVFEPSPLEVLDSMTPKVIEARLMQSILESLASEHSMRMMAMKNASDNAGDIVSDLTLEFNSARQASITQELSEITGGAAAIS